MSSSLVQLLASFITLAAVVYGNRKVKEVHKIAADQVEKIDEIDNKITELPDELNNNG